MTTEELKELIKKLVQEYTGTGASGGNATDGNDIPSPRPFADDEEELENYLFKKNIDGSRSVLEFLIKLKKYIDGSRKVLEFL